MLFYPSFDENQLRLKFDYDQEFNKESVGTNN